MTKYEQRMFFERLVAMRAAYRAVEHGPGEGTLEDVIADAECLMIDAEELEAAIQADTERSADEARPAT
ncbi:MAG TPA: hypothetical protein VH813_03220 [Candidatus Limnocylindrales bacterium]|jgi:hypothetical protein